MFVHTQGTGILKPRGGLAGMDGCFVPAWRIRSGSGHGVDCRGCPAKASALSLMKAMRSWTGGTSLFCFVCSSQATCRGCVREEAHSGVMIEIPSNCPVC